MKALDEYFLMVVFMLLLNRVHVFAKLMFNLNRGVNGLIACVEMKDLTLESCKGLN